MVDAFPVSLSSLFLSFSAPRGCTGRIQKLNHVLKISRSLFYLFFCNVCFPPLSVFWVSFSVCKKKSLKFEIHPDLAYNGKFLSFYTRSPPGFFSYCLFFVRTAHREHKGRIGQRPVLPSSRSASEFSCTANIRL